MRQHSRRILPPAKMPNFPSRTWAPSAFPSSCPDACRLTPLPAPPRIPARWLGGGRSLQQKTAVPGIACAGLHLDLQDNSPACFREDFLVSDETGNPTARGESQGSSSPGSVPVYNCHACLSPPDGEGWIAARACNLPAVVARGRTEREALGLLVTAFKAAVLRYTDACQPIPWADPPAPPQPGEQQRWIAVHL